MIYIFLLSLFLLIQGMVLAADSDEYGVTVISHDNGYLLRKVEELEKRLMVAEEKLAQILRFLQAKDEETKKAEKKSKKDSTLEFIDWERD